MFKYESYTIPLLSSSLYFPLILKQNLFYFPAIVSLPPHFITNNIFPEYIAIPLGIFIAIMGLLIRKPSGGFSSNIENYLYTFYPEKGNLITDGIYTYVRHPRYLGRGLVALGFGIIANNLLAVLVGLIHFIIYCSVIPAEDKELSRRFGIEFDEYRKKVPALFPKFGNWIKLIKHIF